MSAEDSRLNNHIASSRVTWPSVKTRWPSAESIVCTFASTCFSLMVDRIVHPEKFRKHPCERGPVTQAASMLFATAALMLAEPSAFQFPLPSEGRG